MQQSFLVNLISTLKTLFIMVVDMDILNKLDLWKGSRNKNGISTQIGEKKIYKFCLKPHVLYPKIYFTTSEGNREGR